MEIDVSLILGTLDEPASAISKTSSWHSTKASTHSASATTIPNVAMAVFSTIRYQETGGKRRAKNENDKSKEIISYR